MDNALTMARPTHFGEGPPSIRAQQVVAKAQEYVLSQVDPILDEAITYLLIQRPDKVIDAFKAYLQQRKAGETAEPKSQEGCDREQILSELKPVLAKVIEAAAKAQPSEDVLGFVIEAVNQATEVV
uniref:Uncharacterized protein n=1 Tax=Rhizochromulina marina TaxID=1034831 RepID=A0A7S2WPL0_9STRA